MWKADCNKENWIILLRTEHDAKRHTRLTSSYNTALRLYTKVTTKALN